MKYSIITYGCQMNEADSRLIAAVLDGAGWQETAPGDAADLIVINTCSVREKPEHKVYSLLGELRPHKQARPHSVLAVVGCMAQREGRRLVTRAPHVDAVLGTRCFHHILDVVERALSGERPIIMTDLDDNPETLRCEVGEETAAPLRAFVPIILGCNNFCSYCIVPYVRGPETSRPAEEITAEVADLVRRGTREVTLLGQNVLAWGKDLKEPSSFDRLLARLVRSQGGDDPAGVLRCRSGRPSPSDSSMARPPSAAAMAVGVADLATPRLFDSSLQRVRFTTCHPRDVTQDLIDTLGREPKVCEHIHLPIQAGSDKLLREMNRGYTVEYYEDIVRRLREGVPGIAITTDIMVGFPGEADAEFEESLRLYARLRFDAAFTFAYSLRPGTAAAKRPDQVPRAVSIPRLQRLIETQNRITCEINAAAVGATAEILVEGPAERGPALLAGKTRQNKQVVFPGNPELAGQLVRVKLVSSDLWGFHGEVTRS